MYILIMCTSDQLCFKQTGPARQSKRDIFRPSPCRFLLLVLLLPCCWKQSEVLKNAKDDMHISEKLHLRQQRASHTCSPLEKIVWLFTNEPKTTYPPSLPGFHLPGYFRLSLWMRCWPLSRHESRILSKDEDRQSGTTRDLTTLPNLDKTRQPW